MFKARNYCCAGRILVLKNNFSRFQDFYVYGYYVVKKKMLNVGI